MGLIRDYMNTGPAGSNNLAKNDQDASGIITSILGDSSSFSQKLTEGTENFLASLQFEGPTGTTSWRTTSTSESSDDSAKSGLVAHENMEYHGVKRHDYDRALLAGSLGMRVEPEDYALFTALRARIKEEVDGALRRLVNRFKNDERETSEKWTAFHKECEAIETSIDRDSTKHIKVLARSWLEEGAGACVQSRLEANRQQITAKLRDSHAKYSIEDVLQMVATADLQRAMCGRTDDGKACSVYRDVSRILALYADIDTGEKRLFAIKDFDSKIRLNDMQADIFLY